VFFLHFPEGNACFDPFLQCCSEESVYTIILELSTTRVSLCAVMWKLQLVCAVPTVGAGRRGHCGRVYAGTISFPPHSTGVKD